MGAEIIVAARDARELVNQPGNPHMIWTGTGVWVIPEWWYRAHHREAGWLLIMSKADLIAADPEAVTLEPACLAALLAGFAASLGPSRARELAR
jgi:hypothetical protein